MLKFLFIIIVLFASMIFVSYEKWYVTLQMLGYEIHFSFALAIFLTFVLWLVWKILKKPFIWIKHLRDWRKNKLQQSKEAFLPQLLNALANTNYEIYPAILTNARKLYGENSKTYLLLQSLLTPNQESFDRLTKDPSTFLAGTRGLVRAALDKGDIDQVMQLLNSIPQKQQDVSWIQQTKWDIALLQSDWKTALQILDSRKKLYDKDTYLSYRACLLMQLGRVQEAYRLDPDNPAIAVAYAKNFPKKAVKVLMRAWNSQPSWNIYQAYIQAIDAKTPEKRMKSTLQLIKKNPRSRFALMACADTAIQTQQWQRAKENLEVYLQSYPLTKKVAEMFAKIERDGYHHEEAAAAWAARITEAEDITGWGCSICNHHMEEWQPLCPHCNALNSIYPLG